MCSAICFCIDEQALQSCLSQPYDPISTPHPKTMATTITELTDVQLQEGSHATPKAELTTLQSVPKQRGAIRQQSQRVGALPSDKLRKSLIRC